MRERKCAKLQWRTWQVWRVALIVSCFNLSPGGGKNTAHRRLDLYYSDSETQVALCMELKSTNLLTKAWVSGSFGCGDVSSHPYFTLKCPQNAWKKKTISKTFSCSPLILVFFIICLCIKCLLFLDQTVKTTAKNLYRSDLSGINSFLNLCQIFLYLSFTFPSVLWTAVDITVRLNNQNQVVCYWYIL